MGNGDRKKQVRVEYKAVRTIASGENKRSAQRTVVRALGTAAAAARLIRAGKGQHGGGGEDGGGGGVWQWGGWRRRGGGWIRALRKPK